MSSNTHRHRELLLVLLALCAKRPVRRNDLAAELTRRLGSDYRPSPERVECAIGALEAEGLIGSKAREGEITYRTTASGVEALDERAEKRIDTFLFTDVVGSTALLDRLGDHVAHAFRRRHFALLRGAIQEHGGSEVKSLGDGLMVAFTDARAAVACAVAVQRAVALCGDPMSLRIGIDMGEAVRRAGRLLRQTGDRRATTLRRGAGRAGRRVGDGAQARRCPEHSCTGASRCARVEGAQRSGERYRAAPRSGPTNGTRLASKRAAVARAAQHPPPG